VNQTTQIEAHDERHRDRRPITTPRAGQRVTKKIGGARNREPNDGDQSKMRSRHHTLMLHNGDVTLSARPSATPSHARHLRLGRRSTTIAATSNARNVARSAANSASSERAGSLDHSGGSDWADEKRKT
jgi:hypothetical protein